ncbi:MAG: hypothetical protein IKD04_06975 [Clostridia bacterium]|nr:hypothetical protein [Clostridia bacterium]
MEFLDNAVTKAKEAFDIACKKTNEVVSTQKQKFDIAAIENKRDKDYERLGKLYFELVKNSEIENAEIEAIVTEIKEKNEKIKALKEEINSSKNKRVCPQCSACAEESAAFCSNCGYKF